MGFWGKILKGWFNGKINWEFFKEFFKIKVMSNNDLKKKYKYRFMEKYLSLEIDLILYK